ncbi:MAG TPA: formate/nitrite transporter family protein [Thermoanaerobaculia bacterium]|nr:formate/nitrite transporter family protein [Thermoanaerobaculia bacterium]
MESSEEREIEERTPPSSEIIHGAIHEKGMSELRKPTPALAWSGLGAGLAMGFSFLVTALLHSHLPHDAKWAPLVYALGYPIGFVIVILGQQQLFTENTLTATMPLFSGKRVLGNVLRVWGVVLAANVVGALMFALAVAKLDVVDAETFESLKKVAEQAHALTFAKALVRGIFAGWLIALVVWLLPYAGTAHVAVIFILTWIIGAAHFPHIVAGSVDGLFLVFTGHHSLGKFFSEFFVPTLIGNIIGGTLLVAAINYLQAKAGKKDEEESGEGIIIA